MATHIDTIIEEVRNSLKQYDAANVLDTLSMYDWTFKALKRFGNLITTIHEKVVDIEDGKGNLPSNFQSLKSAIKIEPSYVSSELDNDVLQTAYFWKERVEKSNKWNHCKDCEKEYTEKTIVEKLYLHDKPTSFHYKNPTYLKLGRHVNKDPYAQDCDNKKVHSSPYEITINQNTIYTNFKEGSIFVRYYGFEMDDAGKPYIPESPHERLETFLTYHLKRKIFEDLWLNSDDAGIENKIQYLLSQENTEFRLALSDVKAASMTLGGFYKLAQQNKQRTTIFEYPI